MTETVMIMMMVVMMIATIIVCRRPQGGDEEGDDDGTGGGDDIFDDGKDDSGGKTYRMTCGKNTAHWRMQATHQINNIFIHAIHIGNSFISWHSRI